LAIDTARCELDRLELEIGSDQITRGSEIELILATGLKIHGCPMRQVSVMDL
jgi:hypothetical protein